MRHLLVLCILVTTSIAQAKVLFEGWFEVYVGAKKVGFSVQRYEFDNNKFKATTYLKTNADGSNVTESLKAFSGPDLKPQSYSYTSKVGSEIKIIDATFSNDKMNLKINDGKKETKKTVVLKKPGTFLATFTPYVLMAQKKDDKGDGGLQVSKKNIIYTAVAEEDGAVYNGVIRVASLDKVKEKDAFKLLNKFKNEDYVSWITPQGEFLLTRNPKHNIEVRIAENMTEATKDMGINLKDIKILFGKIPGDTIANKTEEPAAVAEDPKTIEAKQKKQFEKHDAPQVSPGVMIKGAPTAAPAAPEEKK